MYCLSLTDPFGTLLMLQEKEWDTRSWRTHSRGWIGIHIASVMPGWAREKCLEEPFRSVLDRHGLIHCEAGRLYGEFPLGAIVGVRRLVECRLIGDPGNGGAWGMLDPQTLSGQERAFGDYTPGRWAWKFADVRRLKEPIPVKGWQKLWNYEHPDLEALITEESQINRGYK